MGTSEDVALLKDPVVQRPLQTVFKRKFTTSTKYAPPLKKLLLFAIY